MILQLIMAFLATLSFGVLFNVPRQQFFYSSFTGMAGWFFYLLALRQSPSVVAASFAAVLAITVLSRIFAVWRKTPITIFLISGILPLVPGAGIYYTAYYFIMGDNSLALNKGIETIKIAVAIALGIVLVLSLPYSLFRFLSRRK